MVKLATGALLTGFLSLALTSPARAVTVQHFGTKAEVACEKQNAVQAGKFTSGKAKCVAKCVKNHYKGIFQPPSTGVPSVTDCVVPDTNLIFTDLATNLCINGQFLVDGKDGAAAKAVRAIMKKCNTTQAPPVGNPANACPDCYNAQEGGTDPGCDVFPADRIENVEKQIDVFGPLVFCEGIKSCTGGTNDGTHCAVNGQCTGGGTCTGLSSPISSFLDYKLQAKCQDTAAKGLSKMAGSIGKCYDKCIANEIKGTVAIGGCGNNNANKHIKNTDDALTYACIYDALDPLHPKGAVPKTVLAIQKKCENVVGLGKGGTMLPWCSVATTALVNLIDNAIQDNPFRGSQAVPFKANYCEAEDNPGPSCNATGGRCNATIDCCTGTCDTVNHVCIP